MCKGFQMVTDSIMDVMVISIEFINMRSQMHVLV